LKNNLKKVGRDPAAKEKQMEKLMGLAIKVSMISVLTAGSLYAAHCRVFSMAKLAQAAMGQTMSYGKFNRSLQGH
jgi:hypothetical protein